MALTAALGGDSGAIEFMEGSILVYAAIAAACSSPQTTELSAGKRSKTLLKWVGIGAVQAAILVGIASTISKRPGPLLAGGGITLGIMVASYMHANKVGLENGNDDPH